MALGLAVCRIPMKRVASRAPGACGGTCRFLSSNWANWRPSAWAPPCARCRSACRTTRRQSESRGRREVTGGGASGSRCQDANGSRCQKGPPPPGGVGERDAQGGMMRGVATQRAHGRQRQTWRPLPSSGQTLK
eukprot:7204578-Prymnesium_polylepis.2